MKIDDIAKQLANKVNQEHYIKHYLERVQRGAYKKGVKDTEEKQLSLCSVSKSLKDNYTPTFEQYRNLIYKQQGHNFLNKETQMYMDYEDMETRYNWHLKNL